MKTDDVQLDKHTVLTVSFKVARAGHARLRSAVMKIFRLLHGAPPQGSNSRWPQLKIVESFRLQSESSVAELPHSFIKLRKLTANGFSFFNASY